MFEQVVLAIALGLGVIFAVSVWSQGYIERRAVIHAEQLRQEVIRAMGKDPFLASAALDGSPMSVKTYYSRSLLSRLQPALTNAASWDSGYHHALIGESLK